MISTEIATGVYDIRRFCHPVDYPIQNPFSPGPTNEQAHQDLDLERPAKQEGKKSWIPDSNVAPTAN